MPCIPSTDRHSRAVFIWHIQFIHRHYFVIKWVCIYGALGFYWHFNILVCSLNPKRYEMSQFRKFDFSLEFDQSSQCCSCAVASLRICSKKKVLFYPTTKYGYSCCQYISVQKSTSNKIICSQIKLLKCEQVCLTCSSCVICYRQVGCHGSALFESLCRSDTVVIVQSLMSSVPIVLVSPIPSSTINSSFE